MGKKLTYEHVKNVIYKEGYTLLSTTYKNALTKLLIRCPDGHEYEVTFSSFQQGSRCPVCAGNKKLTYGHVKNFIESEGYALLDKEYKNNQTKLLVRCNKGHEYKTTFSNFKRGQRCPVCYGNKKLTYEEVKEYFKSKGYALLDKEYKNNFTKLLVKCPEGHEYKTTFNNFKAGYRCSICAGNKKLTYEQVKKYIESNGYTLLDNTYINAQTKLRVRCPEGHEYEVKFNSFKSGNKRCPICNGGVKYTYGHVKNFIESEGYALLDKEYKNNQTKLLVRCPKGHEYKVTFGSFQQGQRCSVCNAEATSSKAEREIQEMVKSVIPNIICNDRTQILNPLTGYNLELDIWIPLLKKAIEYNGRYWHSFNDVILHDKIKVKQCKEKGIDLLVIEEQKWMDNKELEIKRIKNWLKE